MARECTDHAASVGALERRGRALALERGAAQIALGGPRGVLRVRSLGVGALEPLPGALDGLGRRAFGLLRPRDLTFERATLLAALALAGAVGGGALAFGHGACLRRWFGGGRRCRPPLRAAALEHPEAAPVAEPRRRPERLLETPRANRLTRVLVGGRGLERRGDLLLLRGRPGTRLAQDRHRALREVADEPASLVERLAQRVDVAAGDRPALLGTQAGPEREDLRDRVGVVVREPVHGRGGDDGLAQRLDALGVLVVSGGLQLLRERVSRRGEAIRRRRVQLVDPRLEIVHGNRCTSPRVVCPAPSEGIRGP